MKKIYYERLTMITVKSQEELDMIPADFKGQIYIEFGTFFNRAIVSKRYARSVVARENSSVEAWENSSVVARGNSSVVARENSSVVARENSSVEARENSSVEAWGNSSVEAWENSSVEAWENSSVEASGNTQVVDCLYGRGRIEISGNARIVYMPKCIEDFMNFYNIKHDKKKAKFFKAVHKDAHGYFSDYNCEFRYQIGATIKEECDANTGRNCSYGIHIAHRAWALDFGRDWSDLAIIEVETDIDKIIMPEMTDGKVRTSEITVLREVPLEECGIYGKIIAKRLKKEN